MDLDKLPVAGESVSPDERTEHATERGEQTAADLAGVEGGTSLPRLAPVTPITSGGSAVGTTTEKSAPGTRAPRHAPRRPVGSANIGDRVFSLVTTGFGTLIIALVFTMAGVLVVQSRDTIAKYGFGFLTANRWDAVNDVYGAAPAILGTVYTSVLALVIAAPIGILVAIFLVEIAPRPVRFGLGFVVELLAAVPSIVYGLWALLVLSPFVAAHIQPWFIDHFGNLPLFSGYPIGLGYFTAALILAVMILPTITSISRDVMLVVPNSQRDALLALGGTRWEMVWKVVVPYARSGIIGAVILALGRAVGETMAVQMVIGNQIQSTISLFQEATTMPAIIVTHFNEAAGLERSALIELALVLMLIALALNVVARMLVARTGKGGRGGGGRSLLGSIPGAGRLGSVFTRFAVRKAVNLIGSVLAAICLIVAIIPLGAMLFYVFKEGVSSINLSFFTEVPASAGSPGGGFASQIVGTLYLIVIACGFGLPVGILGGIYLARSTNAGFAHTVRFVTDVVAGTPSIVAGMVAYALVVLPMGRFSAVAGGLALGLLMFPTVTRATEETIRLVPSSIREAALALGIPEWKTMFRVILPAATNGVVTAIMLGIARVAGETAPLVFTAFGNDTFPGSPLQATGALPLEMWKYATGPYATWHAQAWAGALTLFGLIVVLNLSARLLTYRLSRQVALG